MRTIINRCNNGKRHVSYKLIDRSQVVDYCRIGSMKSAYEYFPEAEQELHSNELYTLYCFFEGNGTLNVDFSNFQVFDNTMIFLSPGQLHMFSNFTKYDGIVLAFTGDFIENTNAYIQCLIRQELFSQTLIKIPAIKFSSEDKEVFQEWFVRIENAQKSSMDPAKKKPILHRFFHCC